MSAAAIPITPERFAAALEDLSLSSLYAKAAEIRNSISHLQASNEQLQSFADDGDEDCKEALSENEVVIERMRARAALLKAETERRGNRWIEVDEENQKNSMPNGISQEHAQDASINVLSQLSTNTGLEGQTTQQSGSLTDAELVRRIQQQLSDDNEGGMHL